MLTLKVLKKNLNEEFVKNTFNMNILSHIKKIFKKDRINVIDDSKSLEFIISNNSEVSPDSNTIELTFKKVITINNSDTDNQSIDRIVSEVKNFCDQVLLISNYSYKPLNMRDQKNANITTSFTGDRIELRP